MSIKTPVPPCARCMPPRHDCTDETHRRDHDIYGSNYVVAYARLAGAIGVLRARGSNARRDGGRPRQSKAARDIQRQMRESALASLAKSYSQMTGLPL